MANIWHGSDPTDSNDATALELAMVIEALTAVTLNGVRIWSPADAEDRSNRKGHVWSMDGTLLQTFDLPTTLTSGWTTHSLTTPIDMDAGDFLLIGYETSGQYGAVSGALNGASHVSVDGAMAFPESQATAGFGPTANGRFSLTPGSLPDASFSHTFYAIDADYTVPGAGAAPTLTSLTLSADGLDVVANLTASDPDGLTSAVYAVNWGDGDTDSGAGTSFSHTYAQGGVKAILASVTDSTSLSGYKAGAVELVDVPDHLDTQGILDAAASHAASSGYFEWVTTHEPKSAPQSVGAAFWAQYLGPVPANSGLDITSAVLVLNCRIYTSMLTEPQDLIDPQIITATDALMAAYNGDFTLGGLVECVDLLGMTGQRLEARAGYLEQDRKIYRVMTITLPVIVAEAWEQAP